MKDKLLHNLGLKIISCIVAVILWLVVVNVSDPVVDTTYSDIPLTVTGTESLASDGKVYEMLGAGTVTISVSAKRSILDSLSSDNFKAEADLSLYNEETGTVPVRVSSNRYSDKIESVKSKTESVEVLVEDGLRKQFVITPEVSGTPAEGYIIGDVMTAENVVRISGRESVVSSIAKVTAEVSVEGLGSDVNTTVDLKLYDEYGQQIKNSNLTRNISTVAISVKILATKELELRYNYSGKPAEGYTVYGDLTGNMDMVLVAGRTTELSRLNYLDVSSSYLDISGLSETTQISVDLSRVLPDGIVLANKDQEDLVVTVPIEQLVVREFTLTKGSIKIGTPGKGIRADLLADKGVTFELTGVASAVEEVTATDMKASIDWDTYMDEHELAEITPGSYRLPLELNLPEGVSTVKDVTVSLRVTSVE